MHLPLWLGKLPVHSTQELPALKDPLFIADLHLSASKERALDAFRRFAEGPAREHAELVILGDFFNAWVGDDAAGHVLPGASAILRQLAEAGVKVFIAHGNRDPLIGSRFAREACAALVAEPAATTVQGIPVICAHGDAWCTRDTPLQTFRRRNHSPLVQRSFFMIPLFIRLRWAASARRKSESGKKAAYRRDAARLDVVEESVLADAARCGARFVIHGHTHQPGMHVMAGGSERWTLPDWDPDPPRPEGIGGWIAFEEGRPVLHWWS